MTMDYKAVQLPKLLEPCSRESFFQSVRPSTRRGIVALPLRDDNMKSDRTLPIPTIRLSERECGVVAANATPNTGKGLTRRVVTRTATETIRITELYDRRIREWSSQWRLVVIGRFAWYWKPLAGVALKDDVSLTFFE
jgi:hypothetical protein